MIFKEQVFVYLPISEIKLEIDLKNEAVSTLLYHLETDFYNDNGPMIIFHSTMYQNAFLRFYTTKAEDCWNESEFMKALIDCSY